jgi:hypothetical protein
VLLSLSSAVVAMLVVPMTTCSRCSGKAWVGAPGEHGDLGATAARSGREGMRFRHITRLSGSHSLCTRHTLRRQSQSISSALLHASSQAQVGRCNSRHVCQQHGVQRLRRRRAEASCPLSNFPARWDHFTEVSRMFIVAAV